MTVSSALLSLLLGVAVVRGFWLAALFGLAVAAGVVLGLFNWRASVRGLLLYLPFSGIPAILMYPHTGIAVLAKDFLFVIPAYVGFGIYAMRHRRIAFDGLPARLLVLFALVVVLQVFNPALPNVLVGAVGVKVWLLYLPFLFLGYHLVERPEDLWGLLRLMSLAAIVPAVVGIAEAAAISSGHAATIYRFYGPAAAAATQDFAQTAYVGGGTLFRIPSTFTFITQYYLFTTAMISITYAWWRSARIGAEGHFRRFATWLLILVAAFLSGSRGAFLFVPLLVVLVFVVEHGWTRIPLLRIAAVVSALIAGTALLGAHIFQVLRQSVDTGVLEFRGDFVSGLGYVLTHAPFGLGTGTDTGASRYVQSGRTAGIGISGQEGWYLKAVIELGVFGLVVLVALMMSLVGLGIRQHRRLRDPRLRAVSASLLALLLWTLIYALKGSYIDLDPTDVYFWLFAGILFKLPLLERSQTVLANRKEAL